jgi:dinuclear metal center YbgI/SA1388 family protein
VKLSQIYDVLNELSPFELQESWDNSGVQVGKMDCDIGNIFVSLDINSQLLEDIPSNSLLITHHPLIFKPLSNIMYSEFPSSIIEKLIKKDISLISLHTNFDKTHLNKFVLNEILGYKTSSENEFIYTFNVNKEFDEFCLDISEKLDISNIKYVKNRDFIKNCSIVTGSGMSLLKYVKTDCFLTGDIKYHDAMLANEMNISLIDIDHYESEKFFVDIMCQELQKNGINTTKLDSKNPFKFMKR